MTTAKCIGLSVLSNAEMYIAINIHIIERINYILETYSTDNMKTAFCVQCFGAYWKHSVIC